MRGAAHLFTAAVVVSAALACAAGAPAGAAPAVAAVYLSPAGNDAGPCTSARPCRTFDRGYRAAKPGQVVEVAAGRYPKQSIQLDPAKTSPADVLFRPARGAKVTVGDFEVYAKHLELRSFTTSELGTHRTAEDVTARNLTIRGGFYIESSQQVSIIGGSVGPGRDVHPAIVSEWLSTTPPRRIVVDGVLFHDWTRSGPDVHTECLQIGGGNGVIVRNSRFRNCNVMDLHITHFGDAPMTRNVTIENNVFEDSTGGGFYTIQANAYANLLIRNNSFEQGFVIFTGPGHGPNKNVRVIANVGPRSPGECEDGVTFRYNVWAGARCGATDLNAPSGYVDPAAGDFHLRSGAAAIGRGDPTSYPSHDIDGDVRPLGGAPDAGADERP
jgi:hypothetical protein